MVEFCNVACGKDVDIDGGDVGCCGLQLVKQTEDKACFAHAALCDEGHINSREGMLEQKMGLFFAVKEVFFPAVSVENKWVVHIIIPLHTGAKLRIIIDFTKCKAQNVKREVGMLECVNV